jgi:hypothetical protein
MQQTANADVTSRDLLSPQQALLIPVQANLVLGAKTVNLRRMLRLEL